MKKILSILAFVLVAISSNAQVYSNVPAGPIMPVATPFSAYWVNTATDAASGLSLLGGGTNSGGGTTNFLLSGVVTGQTTNNSFSTSGSNVIANIAQQYAGGSNSINNLNGFGTNTTLKSAISISTTNLSAKGTTWLNNSNMTISLSGISISGGGLIPLMTDSNAPSGLATASSSFGGSLPWKAFSTGVTWQSGNETASWLQYQFPSAVTVYSNLLYIQDASIDTNSFYSVAYSQDGSSWTQSFQTNRNPGTGYLPYSIVFPNPFTAKYVRWYFTNNVGYAFSYLVISNQLYGYSSAINLMSNSYALSIVSSNGVAINTNSAGTNALEVFGNVDSTVGFTVNGQPIGSAASSPIGIYSQLYVTNATGTATNFNGIYTSAGSYFTNNTTGWFIVAPATWYPDANTIPRGSYNAYGLVTNLIYGSITPAFSNSTLIGTYSGNPTNIFPTVTPYYGQTSGTTYTNFSGTIGAGGILGSGIDTNLSPAQLASAGVVTTNTGAVVEKWVQLFFSDIDTSALYMYWCDPPATNGSFTVIGTNSIWTEPNGKAIRDPSHIKFNGTYYLAYNVGVTNVGVGIATSSDDHNWQFRGYLSYNQWMHWSPKWFIDATNGLWLQVRVVLDSTYTSPGQIIALKPVISNPTNFTSATMFCTNAWGTADISTAQTVYWNNLYYTVNSEGKIWNSTAISSNNWNLVADGTQFTIANGPCLNRWQGRWYFNDSEDSGGTFWYVSDDLTNWSNVADFTGAVPPPVYNTFPLGSVHEGTAISEFYANPMPSSLGVYAGTFTGNGTNLSISAPKLTGGPIPKAALTATPGTNAVLVSDANGVQMWTNTLPPSNLSPVPFAGASLTTDGTTNLWQLVEYMNVYDNNTGSGYPSDINVAGLFFARGILTTPANKSFYWLPARWPEFQRAGKTNFVFAWHFYATNSGNAILNMNARYMTNGAVNVSGVQAAAFGSTATVPLSAAGTNHYWVYFTNSIPFNTLTNISSFMISGDNNASSTNTIWTLQGCYLKAQ